VFPTTITRFLFITLFYTSAPVLFGAPPLFDAPWRGYDTGIFEIGSGFAGTTLTGLEHNDEFYMDGDRVRTRTNRSGGVQGGITNGETVYFRVAFKPTATVMREQKTVSSGGEDTTITGKGRHDPCVLPRAVPMVEAMAALVLADHALRQDAVRPR